MQVASDSRSSSVRCATSALPGEPRHALARDVYHGYCGELRQRYHAVLTAAGS
ncbi:MAG TPA: hypothetical protein VGX50_13505 [Longimicrobium sp.]|nr:hypothetical protein [Longimicrobium sp.]